VTEHGAGVPGLFPVPGDGVLARHGDLILLCSLEDSQTADDLLDLLDQIAAAHGDGRQFADAIADALDSDESAPSVLAFGPAGSGLAITVSGGAWADITTGEGTVRVEASHPRMLLRCSLRCSASGVSGGLSPDDNGAASTDRFSRLDAGTVRAGGLSFYQAGPAGRALGDAGQPPGDAGQPADGSAAVRLGKRSRPAAPAQTPAAQARLAGVPVAELPEPDGAEAEQEAAAEPAGEAPARAGDISDAQTSVAPIPQADDGGAADGGAARRAGDLVASHAVGADRSVGVARPAGRRA
jgi:hypothetical protein